MKHPRNSLARFVPILLVIAVTIVAVAIVIAIGRALTGSGSSNQEVVSSVDEGRTALLSTDLSRSVRLTVRGPIVADEKFRSYQITISPDARTMTIYEGYVETAIESIRLDNNARAYEELVHALDFRKMMNGKNLTSEQNDLRGLCANGNIYQFETLINNSVVKSLWTTDCSGSPGSAQANAKEIIQMFMRQIPGGDKLADKVGLQLRDSLFRL